MSSAQWTVTGLILLLLGLEAVRSKAVKGFLMGTWTNFNNSLNAASGSTQGTKK